MSTQELVVDGNRALYIRQRLADIAKQAGSISWSLAILLREYHDEKLYAQDGYDTFDEAIESLYNGGQCSCRSRQARYLVSLAEFVDKNHIDPASIDSISISKLREIASLKSPEDQQKLLTAAPDLSVAEVQAEAKRLRDKASGRDTDPLVPLFKVSATQKAAIQETLAEARRVYAVEDHVQDGEILADMICQEWMNIRHTLEAEAIEAMQ